MQILFHLGAHETDGGLLIRSLLKNRAALAEAGIVVPGPGRYRDLLREVSTGLRGQTASVETTEMLLDAMTEDDRAERLVLSNENFICRPTVAVNKDGLYPKAHKAAWLSSLFPGHACEFALALSNPATFIPKILRRQDPSGESWGERLADMNLMDFGWSDVVARIRAAAPEVPMVVWCDEDTPLLWGDLLAEMAGIEDGPLLDGALDRVRPLLSAPDLAALADLLAARGDATPSERRRIMAGFLDAYANADAVVEEIDLPGWTEETVAMLTAGYEGDLEDIEAMDGVRVLTP